MVSNSKVGAFSPALGVRQVLRTRVDRSAIKVAPRADSPHETMMRPSKASVPAPPGPAPLPAANIQARWIRTSRQASMAQPALADAAGVHVNPIERGEAGVAPSRLASQGSIR